jgi:hypothetical protein
MLEANHSQDQVAVVNPASGPGATANPDMLAQVQAAQASGISILGYIDTDYGAIDPATVKAQIDAYNDWYGVDGIFFDRVAGDPAHLAYYQDLVNDVAAVTPGNDVTLNEGVYPDQSFVEGLHAGHNMQITHVAFEGSYDTYVNTAVPAWVENSNTTFADLVYAVPTAADMRTVVQLASDHNSSYVYATPDTLPNPWDTLASNNDGSVNYWSDLVDAVHPRSHLYHTST